MPAKTRVPSEREGVNDEGQTPVLIRHGGFLFGDVAGGTQRSGTGAFQGVITEEHVMGRLRERHHCQSTHVIIGGYTEPYESKQGAFRGDDGSGFLVWQVGGRLRIQ
jgi:hypothetical protein